MSFLSKLFKKREKTETELLAKAEAFIEKVEKSVKEGNVSAVDIIEIPQEIQYVLDFGSSLHERFATLVLTIIYEGRIREPDRQTELYREGVPVKISYKDLPAVSVITDEEATTIGQFIDATQKEEKDVMVFTAAKTKGIQFIIGMLYEFATHPHLLLSVDSDADQLCIKREFFLSAIPFLKRDDRISKLKDALLNFAKRQPGIKHSADEPYSYLGLAHKFYR